MSWFGWTGRTGDADAGWTEQDRWPQAVKPAAPNAAGFFETATPGDEATGTGTATTRGLTTAPAYSRTADDRALHLHVANFPYLFKSGPTARAAARGRGRTAGPPATYGTPDPAAAPPPAPPTEDGSTQ